MCFTVVSLLPQQQMAPRKLCWVLSVLSLLSIPCQGVAFSSQESPAWLRTAYFGHQKTLYFHCCLVKSWKTNTGATSSGTMWRYCLFQFWNTLGPCTNDLQKFCLKCLASLIRNAVTAAKLSMINMMCLFL